MTDPSDLGHPWPGYLKLDARGNGPMNFAERGVLLAAFAAVLAILGLLIAGVTATAGPTIPFHLPHSELIPRGEIPFMQTIRALGTNGGGFLRANHPGAPSWVITALVAGFGAVWAVSAWLLLLPRPSPSVSIDSA